MGLLEQETTQPGLASLLKPPAPRAQFHGGTVGVHKGLAHLSWHQRHALRAQEGWCYLRVPRTSTWCAPNAASAGDSCTTLRPRGAAEHDEHDRAGGALSPMGGDGGGGRGDLSSRRMRHRRLRRRRRLPRVQASHFCSTHRAPGVHPGRVLRHVFLRGAALQQTTAPRLRGAGHGCSAVGVHARSNGSGCCCCFRSIHRCWCRGDSGKRQGWQPTSSSNGVHTGGRHAQSLDLSKAHPTGHPSDLSQQQAALRCQGTDALVAGAERRYVAGGLWCRCGRADARCRRPWQALASPCPGLTSAPSAHSQWHTLCG